MEPIVAIEGAEPWSSWGHGPRASTAVVVTHGFTGSPASTRPLGQRLAAEGYRVEVPLLPGHGTTVRDLARTRYADWVATLDRLVDHLRAGCERVVLVGLSVGGTLSLDVASRRVDEVDAVAVINPLVSDRTGPLAKVGPVLQHVVPYIRRDLAGMPFDDIARPGPEEGAYRHVPTRTAQSLVGQLPRIREQLSALTQPTLIAWSPQDHTVPAANAVELRRLIGSDDVTEVVCARSYHVATLDYDADQLEDAIVAFVARSSDQPETSSSGADDVVPER